jgi:hypothetical protein
VKSIENFEESRQFEQAKQIALAAATLDADKNSFPNDAREIATRCVSDLHRLAEKLAGSLSSKIYL